MRVFGFDIIVRRAVAQVAALVAAQPRPAAPVAQYDLDALGWCIAGECDATLAGGKPMPDGIDYVLKPNTSIARTLEMLRRVRMSAWVIQPLQSGTHVVARARPAWEVGR